MGIANYYLFDLPQALSTPLYEQMGVTPDQTLLLYTAYSLPNTVLPFFGGVLVSKIGDSWGVFIMSMFIFLAN